MSKERNIALEYMPADTMPVDIAVVSQEWWVCHYQPIKKVTQAPEPITNFVQFIKSQPAHISQYYDNITCEFPDEKLYKVLKESPTILISTDGGVKALKGSIGFILTNPASNVLLTYYRQPVGHNTLSCWSETCIFLAALSFFPW